MKRLSLDNQNSYTIYKLSVLPDKIVIKDGFSGLRLHTGEELKGACMSCMGQHCAQYGDSEIFGPTLFASFEKNRTPRVCPTDAISFNENGQAHIDKKKCIKCGLCIHRCPYAAIQFSINTKSCEINVIQNQYVVQSTKSQQDHQIESLKTLSREILFEKLTKSFCEEFQSALTKKAKKYPDLSEVIVRNTFMNLGIPCSIKPAGNNHVRTEFFAQIEDKILIGESEITNTDTLSVCRRILDDITVLVGRFKNCKTDIIPIAVINGLPNKRTDYYEVVSDVYKVLGIQISTITYYLLFVLQLFQINLTPEHIKMFYVSKDFDSLIDAVKTHIAYIFKIDDNICDSGNYLPSK